MKENELSLDEQHEKITSIFDEYMLNFQLMLQKTIQEQLNKHNITETMIQGDDATYSIECRRYVEEAKEDYVLVLKPDYISESGYQSFYYLCKVDFKGGDNQDMIQILTPAE